VRTPYIALADCIQESLERKEWGYIRIVLPPTVNRLTHRNKATLTYPPAQQELQYLIDIQQEAGSSSVNIFAQNLDWPQ
jgi:hypothetical protein